MGHLHGRDVDLLELPAQVREHLRFIGVGPRRRMVLAFLEVSPTLVRYLEQLRAVTLD